MRIDDATWINSGDTDEFRNYGDTQLRGHNTQSNTGTQHNYGMNSGDTILMNSGDTILISTTLPGMNSVNSDEFRGHNTN